MPARYSITNQRPLCWSMHLEPSCSGVVLLAPTRGSFRILRGGSWLNFSHYSRSAFRNRFVAINRFNDLGFRLVREFD